MVTTPFPIDPVQTAIAVSYRNPELISDLVFPRQPVAAMKFKYQTFSVEQSFRRPSTVVGRRGLPNEIDLELQEVVSECVDYGLEQVIPQPDMVQGATIGYNPLDHGTMELANYVAIDREVRAAELAFDAAQYPSSNKVELTGNDGWDVAHEDSNPIVDIVAGQNACLVRPTRLLLGYETWQALRVHPRILKAIHGTDGDQGIATRAQVATLFEIEQVVVGSSWVNTAKFGQAAVLTRVPHALLYRADPVASIGGFTATFGLTAQFQSRFASVRHDPAPGLRGSTRLRVGESVKELVIAARAAFLIENAVGLA